MEQSGRIHGALDYSSAFLKEVLDVPKYTRTALQVYFLPSDFFRRSASENQEAFYARYTHPWTFFLMTNTLLGPLILWTIRESGAPYQSEPLPFLRLAPQLSWLNRIPPLSKITDMSVEPFVIIVITAFAFAVVFAVLERSIRGAKASMSWSDKFWFSLKRLSYAAAVNDLVLFPALAILINSYTKTPKSGNLTLGALGLLSLLLFLNAVRCFSHCRPPVSPVSITKERLGTASAVLLSAVLLFGIWSAFGSTSIFNSPMKERDIQQEEYVVMGDMYVLKNELIKGLVSTGTYPSVTGSFANGYQFKVTWTTSGNCAVTASADRYGKVGSGRRSFFLPCMGGYIRGLDPLKQETVDSSQISADSPVISSENQYFPPQSGVINREALIVKLSDGTERLANNLEAIYLARQLTVRFMGNAEQVSRFCKESGSTIGPNHLSSNLEEVRRLGERTLADLDALRRSAGSASLNVHSVSQYNDQVTLLMEMLKACK